MDDIVRIFRCTPFDTTDVALCSWNDPALDAAVRAILSRPGARGRSWHLRPHLKRIAQQLNLERQDDGRWRLPLEMNITD
jgi:hypothetical protein